MNLWPERGPGWLILDGYVKVFVSSGKLFQLQPSWCSPQRPYLNHKCLSFLNRSQVLVSWGILGPIKACWQWLSPLGPPQGSAPLLTSLLLPSYSSNGSAPRLWLVQHSTQKNPTGVNVSFHSMAPFLLAALFWLKSGLIKDNPVLSCGQIILTPI